MAYAEEARSYNGLSKLIAAELLYDAVASSAKNNRDDATCSEFYGDFKLFRNISCAAHIKVTYQISFPV